MEPMSRRSHVSSCSKLPDFQIYNLSASKGAASFQRYRLLWRVYHLLIKNDLLSPNETGEEPEV